MKIFHWIVGALALVLCAMGAVFGIQTRQANSHSHEMETLLARVEIAQSMPLLLEKYRLQNGQFRKMSEPDIAGTKTEMKNGVAKAVDRLAALDPTSEEADVGKNLLRQVDDFLLFSAQKEPTLFLRNIYILPEAKRLHETMVDLQNGLRESARKRWAEKQGDWNQRQKRWTVVFAALSVAALLLMGASVLSSFVIFTRPLRKLVSRVKEIREGRLSRGSSLGLRGGLGEIEEALDGLATTVDSQSRSRHEFVRAIVTDLKTSMVPLQTSSALLGVSHMKLDDESRASAADHVRRSAVRLSATLADLDDATRLEQDGVRLDEKIVDLREILQRASQALGGPGCAHLLKVFVPSAPVWAWVDPTRIERAVLTLISKLMVLSPQGGQICLSLSRRLGSSGSGGGNGGAEVRIHPQTQGALAGPTEESAFAALPRATGPEQEVRRHWSSENGFGLTLAQRIAEAHGGALTAAGLPGSSVLFALKLPETRMSQGKVGSRPDFSLSSQPLSH